MRFRKQKASPIQPKYPGVPRAIDGNTAVVEMETAASEAAGAYAIMPSTPMGDGWAAAAAAGKTNVHGRRLLSFQPEGEHAAAAVTAGMSMVGLRAVNFASGQGVAYMHESLYAAVAKRLTYVLNVAARAVTKQTLSVHAGHDDYHAVDDTGFIQVFAKNAQEVADLNLIARRVAELSLNPAICAQDGFLTSHLIESVRVPERELVREYLGDPRDMIDSPTPAQRLVFGEQRRRIPEMFDLDYPTMSGAVQNPDSYQQGVAAQRPFYFDHIAQLADRAFTEYAALTGRHYARCSGYRLEDAEYVIVGQGSLVSNAEAVCDHLRSEQGLRVGVLNVTMFRPFPADLITRMLRGKKAVTVLERVDQPLAVDPPILREIRAAMTQAMENARVTGTLPYPAVASCKPDEVPDFFSGCFGLGGRDLQPGDLIATVENMQVKGARRRQFYLGIDFVRPNTRLPKLQIWQEQLLDAYPHLRELALQPASTDADLLPRGSISVRIHGVGGSDITAMGKGLAMTAAGLLGLHVKARPATRRERKGQPITFQAILSPEPIRLNVEPREVEVVLAPDPHVFVHADPVAGLAKDAVLVLQADSSTERSATLLPGAALREIKRKRIKVFLVDASALAAEKASAAVPLNRALSGVFLGAFLRVSAILEGRGLDAQKTFDELGKLFGDEAEKELGSIRRGFEEVRQVDPTSLGDETAEDVTGATIPTLLDITDARPGVGNPGRFWEQVCYPHKTGGESIADPFSAMSAIPAATSAIRDMTALRVEVPAFVADKCTGCGQCWTQCPEAAIPGVVNTIEQVLEAALASVPGGNSLNRARQVLPHLAREARTVMTETPFTTLTEVLSAAYPKVVQKLKLDPERSAALDTECRPVFAALADFPLAKTEMFFDAFEAKKKGSGGLLSVTVNPEACKGCNICVEACAEEALIATPQDEAQVEKLRRNWRLWSFLPETDDCYTDASAFENGIDALSLLLLKKRNYRSMFGGDSACMGCGEKTALHLVLSVVNSLMLPRVEQQVKHLDDLIQRLDAKARELLSSDADLDHLFSSRNGDVGLPLEPAKKETVKRVANMLRDLKDLRWRYVEGPGGRGRAACGITNATGCSSVWGGTYPYNPYPFPWVSHLFQDAPSVAIGIFEGHMRKMADGFIAVRRAELELEGSYDAAVHEPLFAGFDWRQFNDEEFALCPPILAVGGNEAMGDGGFQNLSRLMVSGKPVRVIVLDTQEDSSTGGQASTTRFIAPDSTAAGHEGNSRSGQETRKELALLAIAHRNAFVLQSSQASPSHLLGGLLKGLNSRHPAVFILNCPCPPEHGFGERSAFQAAKLALESRAFPILTYDPDAGRAFPDRFSLDGNPAAKDRWPTYELKYIDNESKEQAVSLPLTIADWAATESRFEGHFSELAPDASDEDLVFFADYIDLPADEREEKRPFIYVLNTDKRLGRLLVSGEIALLADERLHYWSLLRQLAGTEFPQIVRENLGSEIETAFNKKLETLRAEYEAKLSALKAEYPWLIARRLAAGLLSAGNGSATIADILGKADISPLDLKGLDFTKEFGSAGVSQSAAEGQVASVEAAPTAAVAEALAEEEDLVMEPYIESARCTTCDECTRLNGRMFAYDANKQAYIKDMQAGSFKDLVIAAEKCPVGIIHPGQPLNPDEKDLDKLIKRAERFN